ncbi:LemA family protein, partial [Acinetobacter baumannii]
NLVSTVKGYASHEASVLTQVTEARAKVGSVQLNADQLDDEQAVQRFQKAQGELSSALSRLLVVTENYPQLKADGLFKDLLTQLEGTEN